MATESIESRIVDLQQLPLAKLDEVTDCLLSVRRVFVLGLAYALAYQLW